MACTNCGGGNDVVEYTLRFTRACADGETRHAGTGAERPRATGGLVSERRVVPEEIDLALCRPCVENITDESGIELA